MPMRVTCPNCQVAYTCPDEYRGKRLKCKKCQQVFSLGQPAPWWDEGLPVKSGTGTARPPGAGAKAIPPRPGRVPTPPPAEGQVAEKRGMSPVLIGGVAVLAVVVIAVPVVYFLTRGRQPVAQNSPTQPEPGNPR